MLGRRVGFRQGEAVLAAQVTSVGGLERAVWQSQVHDDLRLRTGKRTCRVRISYLFPAVLAAQVTGVGGVECQCSSLHRYHVSAEHSKMQNLGTSASGSYLL
jgi:hypothetical protein